MKHLNLTILALLLSFASFAQIAAITGPSDICSGSTGTMSDITPGGTWSLSPMTCAVIGSLSGIVTGVAPGVVTVTYTVGASSVTHMVTIDALPSPISSPSSVCVGGTITPTDPTPGGAWSLSTITVAMISITGVLTGVTAGTTVLTYTSSAGCFVTQVITVEPNPAPITGITTVCASGTTTLSDLTAGGVWSSSSPVVATVGSSSGIVTGTYTGTAVISYSIYTGCAASTTVTVVPASATFTVTGGGSYCTGSSGVAVGLSGSTSGSSYQLYNGTTAIGAPVSGTGSAISFGLQTATGIDTVKANPGTGCASTMTGSAAITANPLPTPYNVTGGGVVCSGTGVLVGLSGSNTGIVYQLYIGGIAIGSAVAGTGFPLNWGLMTMAGVYTVVGTNVITSCSGAMTGSVTITTGTTPAVYTIIGGGSYCSGGTGILIGLSSSDAGINYSLYNGVTLVSTLSGTGAALSFGTITLAGSYTIVATNPTTGCTSTTTAAVIAINPLPIVYTVTGGGTYCSGGIGVDISLTASDIGVNYQLYNGGVSAGAPVAGTGGPLDFGFYTAAGTYSIVATNATTGCTNTMSGTATITITATVIPGVSISTGTGDTVCSGTSVTFTATPVNGGPTPSYAWTVNGVAVGGTGSTHTYTPAGGDVIAVTLTSSALCASPTTASSSITITVLTPTVTATATAACGGVATLTAGGASTYSWSPSTGLSCSTCATATVLPAGTVTYTVTGTEGPGCTGTATVTVDGNRISGYISYTLTPSAGDFKVWLIQFNPIDSSISALDSTTNCVDGGMPYYEFMDKAAGDYMVKAKLNSSVPGTSGYIPTYSLSAPHWDSAATLTHASSADTMHINMVYGTVPAGPGFIAGLVVSGAGKGTSGEVPAAGMVIYLKNAFGAQLTYTTTAADGSYSFSNLAEGGYYVYPENYKDYTTPSALISLAPGSDSASAINFKQHTTSGTITPYDNTKVHQPVNSAIGISIFPNPTTGNLNIQWNKQATGNADVVITDMTGREVLKSALNINTPSGQTQIDLGNLNDGIYLITIRSENIYYTSRLAMIKN